MGGWGGWGQRHPGESRVLGSVKGRVSCIMNGGCYFHHMVLSGVIVVFAPSALLAACSQIAFFGVSFNPPPPLFLFLTMEMELVSPSGFH